MNLFEVALYVAALFGAIAQCRWIYLNEKEAVVKAVSFYYQTDHRLFQFDRFRLGIQCTSIMETDYESKRLL